MKAKLLAGIAAGLLCMTPSLALSDSRVLVPRGQCVSCGKGKSAQPLRPQTEKPPVNPQASSSGGTQISRTSQTQNQAKPDSPRDHRPQPPGIKIPRQQTQHPSGPGQASSSRPGQASSIRPGQASSSRPGQASSSRPGQASSSRSDKGSSKPWNEVSLGEKGFYINRKDLPVDWKTKRPPVEATVKMSGPGFVTYSHGKPDIPGYPYKKESQQKHKGPGPGELKFSDPHKLEILAVSEDNHVHVTGTGGKARAGFLFAHGEGSAVVTSLREGKKELKLDPNSKRHAQDIRVKAHPDESASATTQMKGPGAAWLQLSNSPGSTPPQSPRASG